MTVTLTLSEQTVCNRVYFYQHLHYSTPDMEAVNFSEMFTNFYQTARHKHSSRQWSLRILHSCYFCPGGDCSRSVSPDCEPSSPGAVSDDTGPSHHGDGAQHSPNNAGNPVGNGGSGSGNSSKTRRRRTAFTSEQLLELEREFHAKKYLSLTERSQIAAALKLSEVQVSSKRNLTTLSDVYFINWRNAC